MGEKARSDDLLPGTLDMMILQAVARKPLHGYDIAEFIRSRSEDVLKVEEGALYQALHRLQLKGMLDGEWGVSANNRRAKFYSLTRAGRAQLAAESERWTRLSGAIGRVMGPA